LAVVLYCGTIKCGFGQKERKFTNLSIGRIL